MSKEMFTVFKTEKGLTNVKIMNEISFIEMFETTTDVIAALSKVIIRELDQDNKYKQKKFLKKLVCDAIDDCCE